MTPVTTRNVVFSTMEGKISFPSKILIIKTLNSFWELLRHHFQNIPGLKLLY